MEDTTTYVNPVPGDVQTPEQAAEYLLESIDRRLFRIEAFLDAYEPILSEVVRRMSGPLRWQRKGQ